MEADYEIFEAVAGTPSLYNSTQNAECRMQNAYVMTQFVCVLPFYWCNQ